MVTKGNSSAAEESSMLESDEDGPESSTPQPSSSGAQERHTSPNPTVAASKQLVIQPVERSS